MTDEDIYFDDIMYEKGSAMLRMMEAVLGPAVFQNTLQDYLKRNQYTAVQRQQLWTALTEVFRNVELTDPQAAQQSGILDWCDRPLNYSTFMEPWVLQQGFPIVQVTFDEATNGVAYSQRPVTAGPGLPNSSYGYTWPIPLFTTNYRNESVVLSWLKPGNR